jgi:tousled-like kinase
VDVWSLGVIFFEMLYGRRPFGHDMTQDQILKKQVILKAHKIEFPDKPSVSQETKDYIKNCLVYFQDERFNIDQAYNAAQNL